MAGQAPSTPSIPLRINPLRAGGANVLTNFSGTMCAKKKPASWASLSNASLVD